MKQIESVFQTTEGPVLEETQATAQSSDPGIDQLLTIDLTKPEGSDKKYSVTIVPKYRAKAEEDSSGPECLFFQVDGSVGLVEFSEAESLPLLQSMDYRRGTAATAEDAARIALNNWMQSQQLRALDGIDLHLQ